MILCREPHLLNIDKLSATSRRPDSVVEERIVLMTRFEVEAMLGRENEKAFVSSVFLDLKPPYVAEIAKKPYLVGTSLHNLMEEEITRGSMLFAS